MKGDEWIRQFGYPSVENPAFETWCVVLKDLSPESIKIGLEKYMKSGLKKIDAVQFYIMCGGRLDEEHRPNPYKRLEQPRPPLEVARKHIDKLRETLAKAKT